MKKIISIIIAAVMAFCLCLPAFAAQSATFAVNVVSEDNTKAVVSIDYEGGTAFNCLDFEVTLSSRVSVEKSANGAGLRNFKIYTEDFLVDPAKGDYDTVGILYVITPSMDKVAINRYFKEAPNGFAEIDETEYKERKEAAKARMEATDGSK